MHYLISNIRPFIYSGGSLSMKREKNYSLVQHNNNLFGKHDFFKKLVYK